MERPLRKWFNAGFGVALLILVFLGFISFRSNSRFIQTILLTAHTSQVLARLENVFSLVKDIETGQRGYLITGEEYFLEPYHAALEVIAIEVGSLEKLFSNDPVQRERFLLLSSLIAEKIEFQREKIDLRRREGFEAAQEMTLTGTGQETMDRIRQAITEMIDEENRKLETAFLKAESSARSTNLMLILGSIITLLVVLLTMMISHQGRSERKRMYEALRESEERYRSLVETMNDGLFVQTDGVFTYTNDRFCEMLGRRREEILGHPLFDFLDEENRNIMKKQLAIRSKGKIGPYEITWLGKSGARVSTILSPEAIFGPDNRYQGSFAVVTDITDRKRLEEELRALSLTDELTGLSNRRGFMMLAEQQLKLAKRIRQSMLLVFADLDRMKWINDTFGHPEGDRALREVGKVLRETFRESDPAARISGDEFVVLAMESHDGNAQIFRRRIQEKLQERNARGGFSYPLSLSLGIVQFQPDTTESLPELITRADGMMYREKHKKKNSLLHFPEENEMR